MSDLNPAISKLAHDLMVGFGVAGGVFLVLAVAVALSALRMTEGR